MAWRTNGGSEVYLNDPDGGQGLVGVEGGMGYGMSLRSFVRDSYLSKTSESSHYDELELLEAAQQEYQPKGGKKKRVLPGTLEVRVPPANGWLVGAYKLVGANVEGMVAPIRLIRAMSDRFSYNGHSLVHGMMVA